MKLIESGMFGEQDTKRLQPVVEAVAAALVLRYQARTGARVPSVREQNIGDDVRRNPHYGTEMYYDWECRRAGDAWPEHQLEDKYKLR